MYHVTIVYLLLVIAVTSSTAVSDDTLVFSPISDDHNKGKYDPEMNINEGDAHMENKYKDNPDKTQSSPEPEATISSATTEAEDTTSQSDEVKTTTAARDLTCKDNLTEMCKNESYWGEMSARDVNYCGGGNMSISWCPKFIRNQTICPYVMVRLNHLITTQSIDTATVSVDAHIPGFNNSIYNNEWKNEQCKDKKFQKQLKDVCASLEHSPLYAKLYQSLCSCPIQPFNVVLSPVLPAFRVPNPLGTIVPAGSYHLLANITAAGMNKPMICIDGWLEFGL